MGKKKSKKPLAKAQIKKKAGKKIKLLPEAVITHSLLSNILHETRRLCDLVAFDRIPLSDSAVAIPENDND